MKLKSVAVVTALASMNLLQGCASPHVVQAVQIEDAQYSCNRLTFEISEADRFRAEAQAEKGVTGTNVAAVLFFWPAMIGTYANANEAIAAADTRKVSLLSYYNQKKCADQTQQAAPAGRLSASAASAEVKKLKAQVDDRKLSDADFTKKRQDIIDRLY